MSLTFTALGALLLAGLAMPVRADPTDLSVEPLLVYVLQGALTVEYEGV
jgi:hypothetical protein